MKTEASNLLPSWINIVFGRFSLIYGNTWAGDDERLIKMRKQEWVKSAMLSDMTNELANDVIDYWKEKSKWAPSISEFCEAYEEIKKIKRREKEKLEYMSRLPEPKRSENQIKAAEDAIKNIRNMLNKHKTVNTAN